MRKLLLLLPLSLYGAQAPRKYTAEQLKALRPPVQQNMPKFNPYAKKRKGLKITITPPTNTPGDMSPVDIVVIDQDVIVTFHDKKK
jgi:hypothetical protein